MRKNGEKPGSSAKKSEAKKKEGKKPRGPKPSKEMYHFERHHERNKLRRILRSSGPEEARRWANQHAAEDILLELMNRAGVPSLQTA